MLARPKHLIAALLTLPSLGGCQRLVENAVHEKTMDAIERINPSPWKAGCPITGYARAYASLDGRTIQAEFGTPDEMGFAGRRWVRPAELPVACDGPPLRVLIDRATSKIKLIDNCTGDPDQGKGPGCEE